LGSPLAELIHHPGLFNSVFNVDASKQLQTERISTLPAKMAFPSNLFLAYIVRWSHIAVQIGL
jgi:hypothetical protein